MKKGILYVMAAVSLSMGMEMSEPAFTVNATRQRTLKIETTDYGQVSGRLKESGVSECDTLSIAGPMDISDFRAVRDYVPDSGSGLEMLDLRQAALKNNEVPDSALWRKQKRGEETALLKIRNILLPEGIVRIGKESLGYMELRTVNIPQSVRQIGPAVFDEDWYLDCELEIPEGVDCVAGALFYRCRSLKTAPKLPSTIRIIEGNAFEECGFEEISLPEGIKTIDYYAFSESKIKKIEFPSTCNVVEEGAFSNCPELEVLDMKAASIEYIPFHFAPECRKLRILRLPQNCREIMPDAFTFCDSLEVIEFGEGLETLNMWTFSSKLLETVTLPSTLTSMGPFAFCPRLLTIYCKAKTPPRFNYDQGPLIDHPDRATLYVPTGTRNVYAVANGWKDFDRIEEVEEFPEAGVKPCIPDDMPDDGRLFDLDGRKVKIPAPGQIYIRNGRKIKL